MASWPPNPRGVKSRSHSSIASHLPVTVLLILVSVITAALTQLGHESGKADAFFMASKQRYQDYEAYRVEFNNAIDVLSEKLQSDEINEATLPEYQALQRWESAMSEAKLKLKDPLVDIRKGQVWRLVTPMFIHFGILHLAFNMMWLWQFGAVLEIRFRSFKFLALVLAVAAISNLAQGYWSGTNFGGMSGVNYGLFGFLFLRSKLHPSPEFTLSSQTVATLIIWMVVCCFTDALGPIANAAHLAGFFGGAAIGTGNAMLAGGWQVLKRRQKFRSAMASSATALHLCSTCGKTECDDPSLEFYVSSMDDQEYCQPHLPENQK